MFVNYAYTPLIWPMFASAVFSAALGIYAWRHRNVPGAAAFAIQELGISLWALFTAMEIAATDLPTKVLHHKLEAVSALVGVSALLYFAIQYAGTGKWANPRTAWMISSYTIFLLLLMATNDLHHLLWKGFWFDGFVRVDRGPLNLLVIGSAFLYPTLSFFLFIRLHARSGGVYRRQALLLILGNTLPLLTYFLEPAGINPVAPLDPVILVWTMSSLLFAIAIFQYGMLDIVPVGRHTVFERMVKGVLILDREGRIVDLNHSASDVLGFTRKEVIGLKAIKALAVYPELVRFIESKTVPNVEMVLQQNGQPRYYLMEASPLVDKSGFRLGRLIFLQDITDQKQVQAQILQQQESLAVLHERERLARELHDSLGQAISAAHLQATAASLFLSRGEIAQAGDTIKILAEATVQAEADLREYLLGVQSMVSADRPFYSTLHEYLERFTRQFALPVDLSIPPGLECHEIPQVAATQLLRIIQEGLSNVRKHAQASHARVEFARSNGTLRVLISDDGKGFDPEALAAQGFGLQSMRERAEALGGAFHSHSTLGGGTHLIVELPMEPANSTP